MPVWMWVLAIAVTAFLLDRVLLRLEAKGWINWRRNGISRGAPTYHALQLQTVFDPAAEHVLEVEYAEEKERDDSGAPPNPERPE